MQTKLCIKCNTTKSIDNFFSNGFYKDRPKYKPYCRDCSLIIQKEHSIQTLKDAYQIVHNKSFGCSMCGYNKNYASLDFHHLNPEEKEFSFAGRSTISLNTAIKEMRKCILLCRNCHSELHNPTCML